MKHLNKIIFINSANIPYAEISVDGNVHFTGTQGVGKSTVLRALLFFYNADKHRLGIQQGQKTFDEFYFRQSNSHILYEVMRDNGAYTILVSRYQGRASWRFIDAPYQREWLIGEDKQVLSDWVKIRERIGKQVAVSARIDSGVMFRDIIFGNTRDHKYTRYAVVGFNRNFKPQNAFHFNTMPVTDHDYLQIAADLQDFMDNNKIEEFRRRTSEHYKDILGRISTEIGALMKRRSDVDRVIQDINRDFVEKNFAGVIKSIELRANESSDKLMRLLMSIHDYTVENEFSIGELNLFSGDNRDEVNRKVVDYLKSLAHQLLNEPNRPKVSLGDAFRLQFRVKENDNDTLWVERINNVGSDGTDILVKAMVNIMLINVFKKKAAKKSGDFIVHCMMDEIGRLHPNNIKGILQFANSRNIYLINSSPTSYNPYDYRYTYLLSKQGVKTRVEKLLKRLN